jgi:L-rhamnonate dehydratase
MQIRDVVCRRVYGHWTPPDFPSGDRQANQLDIYPEFNAQDWTKDTHASPQEIKAIFVEILTDEGVNGIYGSIEEEQAYLIRHFLRDYLVGRDPLASELLSDQMMRLHRHGRSGMFMTAISAVDCALWDLKGKTWGQPVYRLLGGPTRDSIPAYASLLGYSIQPDEAMKMALEFQAQGYLAQKWFFRYGPGDGTLGMQRNIALVKGLRSVLGEGYPLMFDAFMGWDVPYTIQMLQALEEEHPSWVEEPIPPERISAFVEIKQNSRVPLATGEHVYTRWQVEELLSAHAVDFIQADPDWCGGISELVKIAHLCSARGVPLVAHGHSLLPALHVAAAQSPTTIPWLEYLLRFQEQKQYFQKTIYRPKNGSVVPPDVPGLGLVIDNGKIEKSEEIYP